MPVMIEEGPQTHRRGPSVARCFACIAALGLCVWTHLGQSVEEPEPAAQDARKVKPADWTLLMDKHGFQLEVTRLKLIMYQQAEEPMVAKFTKSTYIGRRERCEIETTDRLYLHVMAFFLSGPYRGACPETPKYDTVLTEADECLGELHVTTTSGTFMLGITLVGFALQSKEATARNSFQSWGVATVVDRLLRDHGKQGLSPTLFSQLSPELRVDMEKRHLRTMEEELKRQQRGATPSQKADSGGLNTGRPGPPLTPSQPTKAVQKP